MNTLERQTSKTFDVFFGYLFSARRFAIPIACSAAMIFTVGCGSADTGPATVPVAGKVTLSGKPVAGAEVTFLHDEFAAFAETDADGKFTLRPGAVVGSNKILISKWEGGSAMAGEDGIDAEQMRMMAMTGGANAPKQLVPQEYTDATTTPLQFDVPEGGTDAAVFEL